MQALIEQSEHIVVCAHVNPDGDAIGSTLGWACYLRSLNKEVTVVVPNQFPDFLRCMPGVETIVRHDKHPEEVEELLRQCDLLCCLDHNDLKRLEDMQPLVERCTAPVVMIDHHPFPVLQAQLAVSHPEMSSTCELVFRLVWQLGGFPSLNRLFAIPIYCGMMTDTGGFTYNSNTPDIFFIVAQLLTKGIDKDRLYRQVYHNFSENRLRLMGYVMYQKLQVLEQQHAAFFSITRQEQRRFQFIKGDAEGLVNMPLQIKGIRLSISLREDTERDNLILLSLRSVDDFPCNKMAEQYFNGGGHLNAAGGRLQCTMREAVLLVMKAISEFKPESKQAT